MQLTLWPLPHGIVMPLYLLVVALLLLGVLAGLGDGLVGRPAIIAARARSRRRGGASGARDASACARPLRRCAGRLRQRRRRAPRDQKAIERQSALVAPELSSSGTRGPFT